MDCKSLRNVTSARTEGAEGALLCRHPHHSFSYEELFLLFENGIAYLASLSVSVVGENMQGSGPSNANDASTLQGDHHI